MVENDGILIAVTPTKRIGYSEILLIKFSTPVFKDDAVCYTLGTPAAVASPRCDWAASGIRFFLLSFKLSYHFFE